ncbi:MAG: beta-ketoacyl-ACP synthase II [Planctomycetota bacterium]
MNKRRAVITGLGLVTPLGNEVETTFARILAGESGAAPVTKIDITGFSTTFSCEVKDFEPQSRLDPRDIKRMDPFTQYAVYASVEALEDAGISADSMDPTRIGCVMGTGIGGITEIEAQKERLLAKGPRLVSPLLVPKMMFNSVTGHVALHHGLKGPNYAVGSACASGSHAIGIAMRHIQYGDADVVVTGGSEAANTGLGLSGFGAMKALSTRNDDPRRASRPFDRERDGFVLGEGCAVIVLEEREHAMARGAEILAEVIGFGATDDAFHLTAPDESADGPARCMRMALADAGVDPSAIDYVNAHGTSTELNDKTETKALKQVFGAHAYELMVSSTKSMIGHLLGASGAVEAAICALMLRKGVLHPTINQEVADPDCDLDYIPNQARQHQAGYALSNSFGFGGTNACLLLARHT